MKKQQLWTPKNCAWHLEKLITDQMNGSLPSVNRKIVFVFRDLDEEIDAFKLNDVIVVLQKRPSAIVSVRKT